MLQNVWLKNRRSHSEPNESALCYMVSRAERADSVKKAEIPVNNPNHECTVPSLDIRPLVLKESNAAAAKLPRNDVIRLQDEPMAVFSSAMSFLSKFIDTSVSCSAKNHTSKEQILCLG